jgi:hypothetical protein
VAASNSSFVYSANKSSFAAAEEQCNALGGHLAYYTSLEEQQEVELRFVGMGVLFPAFNPSYWLGLSTERAKWPEFRYVLMGGGGLPPPSASAAQAPWLPAAQPVCLLQLLLLLHSLFACSSCCCC